MKATFVLAVSVVGVFATSGAVWAQDMQMNSGADQGATMQQSAQPRTNDPSYGGTPSGTRSTGNSQSTWTNGTATSCITGLSCNIYQGS